MFWGNGWGKKNRRWGKFLEITANSAPLLVCLGSGDLIPRLRYYKVTFTLGSYNVSKCFRTIEEKFSFFLVVP
jgi:hypothetical protein